MGSIELYDELSREQAYEDLTGISALQNKKEQRRARKSQLLAKKADAEKLLDQVNGKFVQSYYKMQHMLVAEESKYNIIHSAQEANQYLRKIKFDDCKDILMLRNRLMTCQIKPKVIDIVQGNVPVLCKLYIGDRVDPIIKFDISDCNNPGGDSLRDLFTYISTESKTPSDKNFMK